MDSMPGFTAPTNLRAEGVWQGGPTDMLTWDPVPGAATYNVYQYDQLIAKGVAGTSYTVPSSQCSTSMTYTVTAVDGDCALRKHPIRLSAWRRGRLDPTQQPNWVPACPGRAANL